MNNNIMSSAYTDNVLLPSVTSIYFYDIINPGHLVAIHPSVSWKLPTWPTGHSNIFQLHGLHQGSFSLLISDVPGSHWKPLLVGGMSHPPWNPRMSYSGSSHQIGVVGHMLKNQNTPQKKREADGDTQWKLQMDNWDGRWKSISTASHDKPEQKYAIDFFNFTPVICFNVEVEEL